MIDFSKAPEGATHYALETECCEFSWLDLESHAPEVGIFERAGGWVYYFGHDICDCTKAVKIPKQNKILIECKTEREQMLCEQVLRMCRGEESEMQRYSGWYSLGGDTICIGNDYRAKPKKELVVPWEFIPDEVNKILINENGIIQFIFDSGDWCHPHIKLDLTDIDLPVTVKRP